MDTKTKEGEMQSWAKEMVVYQIWPRSFKDSNGDGIGDINGVISKLDYLQNLGINCIWFSPLYKSPQKDYGYDISDYYSIAPEYGTMDDFKKLIAECKKRNIRIIMDLVINHTSDQHEWFLKSLEGDKKYHDYYFWRKGKGKRPPNNWMSSFPGDAWKYRKETGEYYLHLFAVEQPDLNHDNPEVREEVKKIMNFYLDLGVDGFREDVIVYISKKEGLPNGFPIPVMRGFENYTEGPNLHKYLAEYRQEIKKRDAIQIGEAPMMTPKKAMKYIAGEDRVLDMVFGFEHVQADCIGAAVVKTGFKLKKLKKAYNRWQKGLYGRAWNTNFLENHDIPRIVSRYGSEDYRADSAKALAITYAFLTGTMFIYQGQEIGMTNVPFETWDDFKDVATFNIKALMEKTHLFSKKKIFENIKYGARDNARTPVQWSGEKYAGFSTVEPWYLVNSNYKEINVEAEEKDPNSVLNFYKKVIKVRNENKETAIYGEFKMMYNGDNHILAYKKIAEKDELFVVVNLSKKTLSDRKVDKEIKKGNYELILANMESIKGSIKPYEARVYKKRI